MTILSYIAIYILGLITSAIICLWIHRQHKKAWQLEYRRLMAGIQNAKMSLTELGVGIVTCSNKAYKILEDTYNGE